MPVHPGTQNCALRRIASLHEKNAKFHLQHSDRREEETRRCDAVGPRRHTFVRLAGLCLAKFGDDCQRRSNSRLIQPV